jgi:hypothetical protein
MSADLLNGDMARPMSLNRFRYVTNDPVNAVDSLGLCDIVSGGITQSSTKYTAVAQTTFADSIGALSVFPFSGGDTGGGLFDVLTQAVTPNGATKAMALALTNAASQTPAGQRVNAFLFSGSAQTFTSALGLVSDDVRSKIGNVVYIAPGNVTTLASGNTSTTVITNPYGPGSLIDEVIGGPTGSATLLWSDCGHDANCNFSQFDDFLRSKAGAPCTQRSTFSNGGGSDIGSAFGHFGYAAVNMDWIELMIFARGWLTTWGHAPTEHVTSGMTGWWLP